jgi:23S rRNA (guanosine2251-2'-O)-methyltransferase
MQEETSKRAVWEARRSGVEDGDGGVQAAQRRHVELERVAEPERYPLIVVLDHLEDPQNFGAILRSCETLGVRAVVYPKDRSSQITPAVIRASAGAIYHLDLAKVVNIAGALEKLREAGYWIYGTAEDGVSLDEFSAPMPLALVLGNEGRGVSNRVAKMADGHIRIPLVGKVESLNVSVAAGILLYSLSRGLKR